MQEIATTSEFEQLEHKLEEGGELDIRLPHDGRLYIDRPLPFLCLYRHPPKRPDDLTHRLVTTQASYLIVSGEEAYYPDLKVLLDIVSRATVARFGRFLVLEIWGTPESGETKRNEPLSLQPEFRISAPDHKDLRDTVTRLATALKRIAIHDLTSGVYVTCTDGSGPPGFPPVESDVNAESNRFVIGLEVEPIYRNPRKDVIYPFLFDDLRRQLADAVKKAFFEFASDVSIDGATNYLALGRRALEPPVAQVDEGLARIDESFDFLLQTTPVNADEAWSSFEESGFEEAPVFRYRPLPVDPELLKRRLFALPIEQVEDPTLSLLFREKQEELDRKITMLRDRGTRQFFYGSLQVYGEVVPGLLKLAKDILNRLPHRDDDLGKTESLDAEAFAEMAAVEFDYYRASCDEFPQTVQIRHDVPAGLMVSRGGLLIGHRTRVPASRIDALLHHEVGTHMLTYFNGRAQPIRLLYNGLAGYESLQEGIAVLSEYLCGGLGIPRLRVLAARVLAADGIIEGCTFPELFRMLRTEYEFGESEAYSITLRTFRGGGLVKDVIYLRGLYELINFLKDGGDLDVLFVGKIALHHLPFVTELKDRGVLREIPLHPRYLLEDGAQERLSQLRGDRTVVDLIEEASL